MRCGFDGEKVAVKRIGNELAVEIERGLVEPSLTKFGSLYYMTMRNDQRAYLSTSSDGQHFSEPKAWMWDDGTDLGSYNTQAHWVTHDDALFLVYTRRGANNDHIPRNRAPLFIGNAFSSFSFVLREARLAVGESERAMYYNADHEATTGDLTPEEALRWNVLPWVP